MELCSVCVNEVQHKIVLNVIGGMYDYKIGLN